MAKEFDYPIRMCIICKIRFKQSNLFRYQLQGREITSYGGIGRSFYICEKCLDADGKKLQNVLCGKYKIDASLNVCGKKLKEIATDGR
ncbi:MAG: hypothetical protein CR967_02320 [Proteobacteria bacterium]|nr:MAG: hypothetical protein CR967_02320 [Pseudomonadota bacterium]